MTLRDFTWLKFTQIYSKLLKFTQIDSNLLKLIQIYSNWFKLILNNGMFVTFRFGWFSNQIFHSWGQTDFKNSFEFANQTRPRASRFITPRYLNWLKLIEIDSNQACWESPPTWFLVWEHLIPACYPGPVLAGRRRALEHPADVLA